MYHAKRIGVFISHIFGYYQKQVCQGIIDKALEYGYTAEIFASMDGEDLGSYGQGEDGILRVPDYSSLDGVIFASDTYLSAELKQKILTSLSFNCSCPIIEIAVSDMHFPAVSLENNSTVSTLTKHFIQVHHAKRICYLGCCDEPIFSDHRESYYRAAMMDEQLTVSNRDVFHASYSSASVLTALEQFTQNDTPDAVVCYNDRLALLFLTAATTLGYHIPEDIAICGCDDIEEAQNINPPLTTVSFPVYSLGTAAVEQLILQMQGHKIKPVTTITTEPIYRNSCGCNHSQHPNALFFTQKMDARVESLENSVFESMNIAAAFQGVSDIDEGMDLLEQHVHKITRCREFYLCLYSDWNSVPSHILEITEHEDDDIHNKDTILLKLAICGEKRLPECSFKKTSLLPEHIYQHSKNAYIVTPLFFGSREFGYIALSYENNQIEYHFQLIHFLMNINQMLQSICDSKSTGLLVERLECLYTKDALTGLYNKHGYNHHASHLLDAAILAQKSLTGFLFDLDCLKQINDTFGHSEGDFAIQVIGHALENVLKENDILARFSGDEFYLLGYDYNKDSAVALMNRVWKYLNNYNQLSSKPYLIQASGGFCSILPDKSTTLDQVFDLFTTADSRMYEQKRAKEKIFLR